MSVMESQSVLAEKNITFHGMWQAEYRISDQLTRNIATSLESTPSRACRLRLTSADLTLELLPTADGKPRKLEKIAFSDLRDIIVNQLNSECLMIIYVDSRKKFSIKAFSSAEEKDLFDISQAYRSRKKLLMQNQHSQAPPETPVNWTLRTSANATSQRPIIANGTAPTSPKSLANGMSTHWVNSQRNLVGYSYRHFSDSSEPNDSDVFLENKIKVYHETELLHREPINAKQDGQPEAYNVGVQTVYGDDISVVESSVSSSSVQGLRDDIYSLSEEMKAIKFLLEKSTGISAEEYYMRRDNPGNRHAVAFHPVPKVIVAQDNQTRPGEVLQLSMENGNSNMNNANDYDLRSIGQQTDLSNKAIQRRYTKKPVTAITSNAYKEKVASLRKRGGQGGSGSGSGGSNSGSVSEAPEGTVMTYSVKAPSTIFGHRGSLKGPSKRTGSTTVVKPIEQVYQNKGTLRKAVSANGTRRVVILSPPRPQ